MAGTTSSVAPDGIMGAAITTVIEQMDKINSFSTRYNKQLSDALDEIKNIAVAQIDPPQRLTTPEIPVPQLDISAQPTFEHVPFQIPDMPQFTNIDNLLEDLDLGDLDIPPMPDMPNIQMPNAPGMLDVEAPVKPLIDTTVELPDAPTITMPEMAELVQLDIPEFTFPELPDFNGTAPTLGNVSVPNVFINWSEPEYQSEILDDIKGKVSSGVREGGTGLPATIEDALFNRARRREGREVERAVQEAVGDWSSRNFSMPPGMLVKQVAVIREEGQLKASELNRDILIEASKWEIENMRFLVEQGLALEQINVNLFTNTANRMFEVAKFNAESQISVFNAQISLFNAQNAAFETLSNVYKTKLEGALAKLSAYKTAVDAQVAMGQINEQHVKVYQAKVEAMLSNVEVYKALVQGASVRSETIKNQFDAYRTEVQAFSEQISAQKNRVEVYEAQIRGEAAKTDMFEANVRAYASRVQAAQSKADIKGKEIQLKMEAARTWISKYGADLEAYKATLQANLNEVQLNTTAFTAQVEAWRASTSVEVAQAETQSRFADMNARTNIAYAEMQMKEYEAKMQKAIQEAQIALESAKALGQYTAQLAAGAMSAAHISASISGNGSASTSYSNSSSKSESHNYNY